MGIVDLFMVYQFIRRLATPFSEWPAYKNGIIDENGEQIKARKDFITVAEKESWTKFDVLVAKIKRMLEKLPGGKTRIASYAAALWLIKEHDEMVANAETLTEDHIESMIVGSYVPLIEESAFLRDRMDSMFEEAPTNNVGGGAIAGVGVGPDGEPPMGKSAQKKYLKKKEKEQRDFIAKAKRRITGQIGIE